MKYQWLIQVGSNHWAVEPVTYGGTPYTKKILRDSFSGINLRWNLGQDLISSNDLTFSISDVGSSLVGTDFDGDDVTITLLGNSALIRAWKMKVKRTTASYQQVKFYCVDILQQYLTGDFPNTPDPKEIWPSEDPDTDDYCIPVVLGTAYVPLRSVNTGSARYYILGGSGVTYTITGVSSPHEWANNSTWLESEYMMTPIPQGSYVAFQPMIHDVDGDGSSWGAGLWKSGDVFLDMPCKFTRSDTESIVSPADWIEYVLESIGVASADIDTTGYTGRSGLEFNGGWWQKESREYVLSSLLNQCDCYLSVGTKIELKPFVKTSQETFTNVLKGSFQPSIITRSVSDGGSVKWQAPDMPQDILTGSAQAPSYYGQASITNQDRTTFEARFISDSQDAQRAAILYFGKKLLQEQRVSFSVAGPSITNLDTLSPGQVITVNDDNYGGSQSYIITGMSFGKDLSVRFDCTSLSVLQDWADVSPSAVAISSGVGGQTIPTIPYIPMIGIKRNIVSFNSASNGYAYIHGFDTDGNASDTKGRIVYDGDVVFVPKIEDGSTWTIATSQEYDGYIVFDTTISQPFTVSGSDHSVAFTRLNSDQWQYDNGTAWADFTPASTDVIIGTMSVGSGVILSANVWAYGQDLGSISDGGDDTANVVNADMLEIQGWTFTGEFTSADADTVTWGSGTLSFSSGQSFSISADATGTGTMSAATTYYIYFKRSSSTTQLQVTTTAGDAVGANTVLMCVAYAGTDEARFIAYNNKDLKITGVQIEDNSITAANITAGTITASEIASETITGNNIASNTITAGKIQVGGIVIGDLSGASTFNSYSTSYVGGTAASTVASNASTGATYGTGLINGTYSAYNTNRVDGTAASTVVSNASSGAAAATKVQTFTAISGGIISTGLIRNSADTMSINFGTAVITVNSANGLTITAAAGLFINQGSIKFGDSAGYGSYMRPSYGGGYHQLTIEPLNLSANNRFNVDEYDSIWFTDYSTPLCMGGAVITSTYAVYISDAGGFSAALNIDGTTTATHINPASSNNYGLGNSGYKWKDVWAVDGTINTSDEKEKSFIEPSDLGLSFIKELQPKKWIWNDGVRPHYGLVAQDVKTTMEGKGNDFAGLIKNNMTKVMRDVEKPQSKKEGLNGPKIVKEEVIIETKDVKPGDEVVESYDSYGLRYHEFIGPMIKAIQELSNKVDTLTPTQTEKEI